MTTIKHPQHILAFDKQRFGALTQGFNEIYTQELNKRMAASLIIARREELETDDRYGQMLPYIVMYQIVDGRARLFTYRRAKGVGESRLLGNASVGLGGHVDLSDVVARDSVIDISKTIEKAILRELKEEVKLIDPNGGQVLGINLTPVFMGVINDLSNAVGSVHYGLLYAVKIPEEVTILTVEKELLTIGTLGAHQLDQLKPMFDIELENWSKMALALIGDIEAVGALV